MDPRFRGVGGGVPLALKVREDLREPLPPALGEAPVALAEPRLPPARIFVEMRNQGLRTVREVDENVK